MNAEKISHAKPGFSPCPVLPQREATCPPQGSQQACESRSHAILYSSCPYTGLRRRAIWLDDDGKLRDFSRSPFWMRDDYQEWLSGNHSAHFNIIHVGRAYQAEVRKHGSRASALTCLRYGGCVIPCDHFRNDWLKICADWSSERSEEKLSVLIASTVSPTGETFLYKSRNSSLQSHADKWRESHK